MARYSQSRSSLLLRVCRIALLLTLLFLISLPAQLWAQSGKGINVGSKINFLNTTIGRFRRLAEKEADDQNFRPWPHINDKQNGTIVHFYASITGAGVEIGSYPLIPPAKILVLGRRLVSELNKPKAILELRNDPNYSTLGLDLDAYVSRTSNAGSFEFDVSQLARSLQNSPELNKPISILVDNSSVDSATLEVNGKVRKLEKYTFFTAETLARGGYFRADSKATWLTYVLVAVPILFFLGMLGLFAAMPWISERGRRNLEKTKAEQEALTPEEIQRKYDEKKQAPFYKKALPFAPFLLLLAITTGRHEIEKGFELGPLRLISGPFIPLATLAPIILAFGLGRLVYAIDLRRRAAKDPTVLAYAKTKSVSPALQTLRFVFIPMGLMMVTVIAAPFLPAGPVRLWVMMPVLTLCMILLLWTVIRSSSGSTKKLGPEDPVYEYAHGFAQEAGVKLTKVQELTNLELLNASMSLTGTLSVTKGLINKLTPDEVRAIVAHEVGHRKARHVQKLFPLSLGITFGFLLLYEFLIFRYERQIPDGIMPILRSPMIFLIFLPFLRAFLIGGKQLQYEREADLFAVKATGDPELVITALTKVHDLNKQPHRITKTDERLGAHPSLENRIATIREAAAKEGFLPKPPPMEVAP
jgi:Zn-dependent protease with chaperone function